MNAREIRFLQGGLVLLFFLSSGLSGMQKPNFGMHKANQKVTTNSSKRVSLAWCGGQVEKKPFLPISTGLINTGKNDGVQAIVIKDAEGLDDDVLMAEKNENVAQKGLDGESASEIFCCYCKELFIKKIEDDIKNKVFYTKALGLKITGEKKNKKLTMALRPLTSDEAKEHNYALFALSLDQENGQALKLLAELYKKRINQAADKSADHFFPKIVVVGDEALGFGGVASHDPKSDTIKITKQLYDEDGWIRAAYGVLHEFMHHLQTITSREMGGIDPCVVNDEYAACVPELGTEIEAEACGAEYHPYPQIFINLMLSLWSCARSECWQDAFGDGDYKVDAMESADLEKLMDEEVIPGMFSLFPYFSDLGYLVTALRKNPTAYPVQAPFLKLVSSINFAKAFQKYLKAYAHTNVAPHTLIVRIQRQALFYGLTNVARERLNKSYPSVSDEFRKKIDEAPNFQYGSSKFFAIREKLGFVPK
ncbi:MAG: hypothetical protein M1549_01765 [Candidatus Dependentiae bacterium]|nr:hypothetical protein [Candidatus Dependentiae bacterium]